MIGAGIVGLSTAWLLQRRGHVVTLVAPDADGPQPPDTGSSAALGVLMGQVFHRSSGRAWRLRQRSLALWHQWLAELAERGLPIPHRPGLLLLAASEEERQRLENLGAERRRLGLAMTWWDRQALEALSPAVPAGARAGLLSLADGQLDPLPAREAFRRDGCRRGLRLVAETAVALERAAGGWWLRLAGGSRLEAPWVVLATGLASAALLDSLGHQRPMEPVLGQALELELAQEHALNWPWPLIWRGWNLVPRPGGRLWLGASLEPGGSADPARLAELRQLGGDAPAWLIEARLVRSWQGLRCRPVGRPAPLLEELEPGLLLAGGHYRNGVLLAPASAEWIARRIETDPCLGPP